MVGTIEIAMKGKTNKKTLVNCKESAVRRNKKKLNKTNISFNTKRIW